MEVVRIVPGDCVLDSSGAVGIVIDVDGEGEVRYKVYTHDGFTFIQVMNATFLRRLRSRFKSAYLSEVRRIGYAEENGAGVEKESAEKVRDNDK